MRAEGTRARPCRGDAIAIDRGELPPDNERLLRGDAGHRLLRRAPVAHSLEQNHAQPRIGDVLRTGRADACLGPGATRRHGRRRRRDGYAELPGLGAPPRDRERHDSALAGRDSGITAMASISTTHSGRASAVTTTPVETGKTPLSQRPIT